MRTDATQVIKKKVTRNTLNIQQMMQLEELGLCNLKERDMHTDYFFGVEELMQLLPACIVVGETMYCLQIYKTAFDVLSVRYYNPKTHETICVIGCDDVMPKDERYNGHLVDAVFEMVLYINQNHKTEFTEYKDKLQHYIKSW